VLALLAEALDLPRRDIELAAGRTSRDKVVALAGVTEGEAASRLAAVARS
jgi:uncharacterized protein YggU (UPF0235/DUF167 family)